MIRKIRRRHHIVWLILAILLPILFAASIFFRHKVPINQNIPKREISAEQR